MPLLNIGAARKFLIESGQGCSQSFYEDGTDSGTGYAKVMTSRSLHLGLFHYLNDSSLTTVWHHPRPFGRLTDLVLP